MSRCRHEWHDYHKLSFPCPDCGAWADESNSSVTDYHELPEVPRCCLTCAHLGVLELRSVLNGYVGRHSACAKNGAPVNGHGLCSHWERRDE